MKLHDFDECLRGSDSPELQRRLAMQLKNRITRLEQHSPHATKTPVYVVARLGEPIEEAKARVFVERGLTDADDDRVVYVTWGRE